MAPQPWRNGRGVTRELVRGDGWRVSLADITQDGPFSVFPGLDRIFVPLTGGFELAIAGTVIPAVPDLPIAFPGEAEVSVRCLAAPAQALNLMLRRGTCHGGVQIAPDDGRASPRTDATVVVRLPARTAAIWVAYPHENHREPGTEDEHELA